jgi:hypothetical protein
MVSMAVDRAPSLRLFRRPAQSDISLEAIGMNQASKVFQGSGEQWLSVKGKQQILWVIVVAAGLLLTVRGGRLVSSFMRGGGEAASETAASAQAEDAIAPANAEPGEADVAAVEGPRGDLPQSDQARNAGGGQFQAVESLSSAADQAVPAAAGAERAQRFETLIAASVADDNPAAAHDAQNGAPVEGEATADSRADEPVLAGGEPRKNASPEVVAQVFAALSTPGLKTSVAPECQLSCREIARALFAAQDATFDPRPIQPAELSKATGENVTTQQLARFFRGGHACDDAPTKSGQAQPADVSVRSWQELLIAPVYELAEASAATPAVAVEQTAGQPAATDGPAAVHTAASEPGNAGVDSTNVESDLPTAGELAGSNPSAGMATDGDDADDRELPIAASLELVLVNPAGSLGTIHYLVNGHSFSMPAGHSQHLPAGREWRVHFHRGGNLDDVEMVLRTGTYEFRSSDAGWQLWAIDVEGPNR